MERPDTRRALWRFSGQVVDERCDGTDVGDDAKDDGDNGEPQSVTRCSAGSLDVALRPCFVGLITIAQSGTEMKEKKEKLISENIKTVV